MKIEVTTDKLIIYLYQYNLSIDNIDSLNNEIKKLFIKLIRTYNIDFYGYFKVTIYNNIKYGNILEIEKIYQSDFSSNIIDLKIIIYKNVLMFFEFDDYYFDEINEKIIIKDNKYYLNIDEIDKIEKYIEFGKINYLFE